MIDYANIFRDMEFKFGDEVYDYRYGYGKIDGYGNECWYVDFGANGIWRYTLDGRDYKDPLSIRTLLDVKTIDEGQRVGSIYVSATLPFEYVILISEENPFALMTPNGEYYILDYPAIDNDLKQVGVCKFEYLRNLDITEIKPWSILDYKLSKLQDFLKEVRVKK